MPVNKSQHFVPQHYLRQFRIDGTKQISVARIEPFQFIEKAAINGQCKQDYFYREDGQLDELLQTSEHDLAPVLARVTQARNFDSKELVALRFLAVILRVRTKKAVETAKILPRRIAFEVIRSAIKQGKLPPPSTEIGEEAMDFKGVAGHLFKSSAIPCWLEMQTLGCKLIEADKSSFFITSDNPVIVMNQLLASYEPHRSYVGFSRSGFQLLLPIAPNLCLFFYDPKVYKVGDRRHRLTKLTSSDVNLINSLQIQNAEECIYFHQPGCEQEIKCLVSNYSSLRSSTRELLRESPGSKSSETLLHMRQNAPKLIRPWSFCAYKRHKNVGPDSRRNGVWTLFVDSVSEYMRQHPYRSVFEAMEEILGHSFSEKDVT